MIEIEDFELLAKHFDERYVMKSDCNERQESVNKRFANDDKRIEKLIDRLNLWDKLLWAIAASSIGALVISFFELILK
jgi:hypothetical protein